MTRSTDRSALNGESHARKSTVFIVAKDPAMHFGNTKPAFAGHGAVLLEVESQEFYEHLKELLAEEQPDLVDAVVPFAAVELKPARRWSAFGRSFPVPRVSPRTSAALRIPRSFASAAPA
jgi:hypothetical protein